MLLTPRLLEVLVAWLVDAPVLGALVSLGCAQSQLDRQIFYFMSSGEACGLVGVHVEDLVFGGEVVFMERVQHDALAILSARVILLRRDLASKERRNGS